MPRNPLHWQVRGGILWGILLTTLIGLFIKDPSKGEAITTLNGIVSAPESVAGKFKSVSITMWILAILFICKYIFI